MNLNTFLLALFLVGICQVAGIVVIALGLVRAFERVAARHHDLLLDLAMFKKAETPIDFASMVDVVSERETKQKLEDGELVIDPATGLPVTVPVVSKVKVMSADDLTAENLETIRKTL